MAASASCERKTSCASVVRSVFGVKTGMPNCRAWRSTGLGRPTYVAEVELGGKLYEIEIGDTGVLIAKSLAPPEE